MTRPTEGAADEPRAEDVTIERGVPLPYGSLIQTPGVCGGHWRIRDTRIPVLTLFGAFRDGWSITKILESFPSPHLTREVAEEAIRFAMKQKPRKEAQQQV